MKTREKIKPHPNTVFRKLSEDEVLVMKLDDDRYFFRLKGLAAEIWTSLNGRTSYEAIKEKLIKKHNPPRSRFEKDAETLLKRLKKEGLVIPSAQKVR